MSISYKLTFLAMEDTYPPERVAIRPLSYPLEAATQTPSFLLLPKELRLLVLEQFFKSSRSISVFRPDILVASCLSPFPDELVALQTTSRQMKDDAEHVLMSFNHFSVSSLSALTFFSSKAKGLFCHSAQLLTLGRDTLKGTRLEEMLGYTHQAFHTTKVLTALRKFSLLQTLEIT